jgi:hypothetical protein
VASVNDATTRSSLAASHISPAQNVWFEHRHRLRLSPDRQAVALILAIPQRVNLSRTASASVERRNFIGCTLLRDQLTGFAGLSSRRRCHRLEAESAAPRSSPSKAKLNA